MKRELHFATEPNSRDIQRILYNLCYQAQKEDVPSKDASFSSRIQVHGKGPSNYNVQPRLVGGGVGEK